MRRRLLVLSLLATVALGLGHGSARAGWGESLFTEFGHDFGAVPRGAKVRHQFVLTNRLNEPVNILDLRPSCGCTSGRASAATVPPGGRAVIEAEMDTRNFAGPKATTLAVSLLTASGQADEVRLAVQSMILSDIVVDPGSVDFGPIARGQSPQATVHIARVGFPGWKAVRMVSTSRALSASLAETARDGDRVSYTLTVALKPDAPAGFLRDEIRIQTNDPNSPAIPVTVTAQVLDDLVVSPSLLSLGRVASAAGAKGRFVVRSSRPFTIAQIQGNGDGFTLAPDNAQPKTLHILNLSYDPAQATARGDLQHNFRILTNLPNSQPLDVTATVHVDP